jgi:predicted dehydrogenase
MSEPITRRDFIRSSAAVGAGAMLSARAFAAENSPKSKDAINVALIGGGAQGQVLMDSVIKISEHSPIHFKAVCDIWEPNRDRVHKTFRAYKRYGHVYTKTKSRSNAYTDFEEMLDTEKDLDAVIVATPDFWHARHAIAAMERGLHVYCEKEMSNKLEDARRMVEVSKEKGLQLQIGHQRRSNPKYRFCYDNLILKNQLLGRITNINGQWNRSRSACVDLGWPEGSELNEQVLNKYGFESMPQFRNWRWFKGKGGGPIVDLGSHQIDIYSWFVGANPKSVIASGGIDYWTDHQWYDNVITIFEYEGKEGPVRASYQTTTTNSAGGYFERFMGDEGTLEISEGPQGSVFKEGWVDEKKWYPYENQRLIKRAAGMAPQEEVKAVLDVRSSPKPPKYDILVEMNKPFHQPHLENFFESVRGNTTLNCPGIIGYETAVAVLRVNEAVEAGRKLDFKPHDYEV